MVVSFVNMGARDRATCVSTLDVVWAQDDSGSMWRGGEGSPAAARLEAARLVVSLLGPGAHAESPWGRPVGTW